MAITNYGQLKAAVQLWLITPDVTTTQIAIPDFIMLAQQRTNNRLLADIDGTAGLSVMEDDYDLVIDSDRVLAPIGFGGQRRNYLDVKTQDRRIEYYPPDDFWMREFSREETGTPKAYTIEGQTFRFKPPGNAQDPLVAKLLYWKKFPILTQDSESDWIIQNAVGCYLYGALLESQPFIGEDARAGLWSSFFDQAINDVKGADKTLRFPPGQRVMRSADVPSAGMGRRGRRA